MAPTRSQKPKKQKPQQEGIELEEGDAKPGCIYIGHIPHGFFEDEMKKYFTQFGEVKAVKLCRSKKTGNSKGYGFVKFRYSAVAKTVAETCHNYLFFDKLLKCEYRPLSDMHRETFKKWTFQEQTLPRRTHNRTKTEERMAVSVKNFVSKEQKKLARLKAAGLGDFKLEDLMEVPEVKVVKGKMWKAKQIKSSARKRAAKELVEGKESMDEEAEAVTEERPRKRKKTAEEPATPTTPTVEDDQPKAAKRQKPNDQTKMSKSPKTKMDQPKTPKSPKVLKKSPSKSPKVMTKSPSKSPEVMTKTPSKSPKVLTKSPSKSPKVVTKSPSKSVPEKSPAVKKTPTPRKSPRTSRTGAKSVK